MGNAQAGEDGTIRAIVSPQDPGLPNWIDSEGHLEGTMLVRCMDPATPPRVSANAVKLDSLKYLAR